MKTVIIGDLHGRSSWKLIVHLERPDRVIFIGDYFDSHNLSTVEQIHNFKEIIWYKEEHPEIEVICLIGNHDAAYLPDTLDPVMKGFQMEFISDIQKILLDNMHHLQMAYQFDNVVCSHAGIGRTWLEKHAWEESDDIVEHVNNVWRDRPKAFCFDKRYDSGGDDIGQTPIWIRPRSLMKDAQDFKKKIIQVVGHTTQDQIDIKGKTTGGRYYFIDTLGTSGEYLIVTDGAFSVNKI